jgi:hypothetical protein
MKEVDKVMYERSANFGVDTYFLYHWLKQSSRGCVMPDPRSCVMIVTAGKPENTLRLMFSSVLRARK